MLKNFVMQFLNWIEALRLRTLFLSVSGVILGSFLARFDGFFRFDVFFLSLFTTLCLQILSNLANDYGDGVKGIDNAERIGPARSIQSGKISPKAMFRAIILAIVFSLFFACMLIYVSFGVENFRYSLLFFLLSLLAIGAALRYTMGKNPYGYRGFGDISVFIFFGLMAVLGSYALYSHRLYALLLLPAISIGFLCVSVLNLNNMRDFASDKKSGKRTLVVQKGLKWAIQYHKILLISPFLLSSVFVYWFNCKPSSFLFLLMFIPALTHLRHVSSTTDAKQLDPELKKVAILTFLFALLLGLGICV